MDDDMLAVRRSSWHGARPTMRGASIKACGRADGGAAL